MKHGVSVHLDYHYDADAHDWVPCLFLQRGSRKYAVKQAEAFKFSLDHMDAKEADLRMCVMGADAIEHLWKHDPHEPLGPRRLTVAADILSMVEDKLDDLLRMPPKPDEERLVIGEAHMTINGQELTTEMLR